MELSSFVYETPLLVVGLVVAGIACALFFPPLALPLFCLAGSSLVTKLATKIITRYDSSAYAKFEHRIWGLHQSYKKWHMVAALALVAIGYFVPWIGVPLCIAYGLYNGIVMEMEHCKAMQRADRAQQENPELSLGEVA